jgi:hypothetical protein
MERKIPGLKMETFQLTANKHEKEGWPMMRTVFEAGNLVLPYGMTPLERASAERGDMSEVEAESVKLTDALVHQLSGIRFSGGKVLEDPKKKNDLVSALFLALKAAEERSSPATLKVTSIDGRAPIAKPKPRGAEFGNPRNQGGHSLSRVQDYITRDRARRRIGF